MYFFLYGFIALTYSPSLLHTNFYSFTHLRSVSLTHSLKIPHSFPYSLNDYRAEFQNRMDAIKQYMVFRKVGDELETR